MRHRQRDVVSRGLVALAVSVLAVACGGGGGGGGSTTTGPTPPAPTLSALAINPTTLLGGAPATLTATLSAAAPASGTVVNLASNNAAVTVPATLAVASGATSGTAQVATSSVTTAATVLVTGSLSSSTQTVTLALEPTPTARFTVVSRSRGDNACQLAAGGVADCDMNGGGSTGSGVIRHWNWTFKVGPDVRTIQTTTPITRPPVECPLYAREPATTAGGQTFIQMIVELTVVDGAGRTSVAAVNPNVRVFPQGNCTRGF